MPVDLERQLVELRRMILAMGAAVEDRVACVLDALTEQNYELARRVRHGDRAIDEMELDIEKTCLRILALTQPVASDLRQILASLRINGDLERMADLAKNIAKRIIDLEEVPTCTPPAALADMARYAREMVADTLSALANEDVGTAERVRRSDDRLDDLQRELFVWAHREIPRDVAMTQGAIDILSITRAVERIGDLATNIAEDVIFLVAGNIVRHSP